ncbi:MAG: hypothetical protein ABIF85_03300 [Nanoarchaeota archaeon]|nr:hypothetical protein [Nanoarchaeota archaeon]MBU4301027.1 hypothetical protein [Nanoarchaeota archaeon]MBU4451711.1 hypothetical protein [Nanoarchaeota archaeon]MCG2723949.1 hypothetical protein [archaeon]
MKNVLDEKFKKYLLETYNVEKMTPEKRDDILTRMEDIDLKEIAKQLNAGEDSFQRIWKLFTGNVSQRQLSILKCIYKHGHETEYTSSDRIAMAAKVSFPNLISQVNLPLLYYMGVLPDLKKEYRNTSNSTMYKFTVDREVMPLYYKKLL